MGIGSSIKFLGWLKDSEKVEVLRQASVFCLPSYGEGVPMAMLEAMSYKIPVVVTPVGGIHDVITDNWNGLFVTSGRIDEIAAAVVRVLTNPVLSKSLAEKAHETVRNQFSPDIVSKKICSLYDNLIGNKDQVQL